MIAPRGKADLPPGPQAGVRPADGPRKTRLRPIRCRDPIGACFPSGRNSWGNRRRGFPMSSAGAGRAPLFPPKSRAARSDPARPRPDSRAPVRGVPAPVIRRGSMERFGEYLSTGSGPCTRSGTVRTEGPDIQSVPWDPVIPRSTSVAADPMNRVGGGSPYTREPARLSDKYFPAISPNLGFWFRGITWGGAARRFHACPPAFDGPTIRRGMPGESEELCPRWIIVHRFAGRATPFDPVKAMEASASAAPPSRRVIRRASA